MQKLHSIFSVPALKITGHISCIAPSIACGYHQSEPANVGDVGWGGVSGCLIFIFGYDAIL